MVPAFNVKMFYKMRFKIIFVKMGYGAWQQHFGKSNKIVLILMPDYLFTSQFESRFFFQINGRTSFESERKNKNDPRLLYMVNCTLCQDIEKLACEHPRRHDP